MSHVTHKRPGSVSSDDLLTTGEVAELCDVSRDTVLKWITAGKIPSLTTPGGHHKVPRTVLSDVLKATGSPARLEDVGRPHLYCWEYHSRGGRMPRECKTCLAYRGRAQRCYDLAALPDQQVHARLKCDKDCHDCNYFKLVSHQLANVMVVTESDEQQGKLTKRATGLEYYLRVVSSEYECARLVDEFRPDFVFIDGSLGARRRNVLIRSLHDDPRLPLVRVVAGCDPEGLPRSLKKHVFAYLRGQVSIKAIDKIVIDFTRPDWEGPQPGIA